MALLGENTKKGNIIKNFRPIAMRNAVLKILTKVFSQEVGACLGKAGW